MLIEAVLRAARILQAQPGYTMPLIQLHAQLARELGTDVPSYGEIYRQLGKRNDSFALVNSPRLLGATEAWPGLVREAYDSALDHAGLGSCVRVTLTETQVQENADLIAALSSTLGELIYRSDGAETVTAYIEAATVQLAEISRALTGAETDRPTIPPPDPHPAE